jgi:hypothetical protein
VVRPARRELHSQSERGNQRRCLPCFDHMARIWAGLAHATAPVLSKIGGYREVRSCAQITKARTRSAIVTFTKTTHVIDNQSRRIRRRPSRHQATAAGERGIQAVEYCVLDSANRRPFLGRRTTDSRSQILHSADDTVTSAWLVSSKRGSPIGERRQAVGTAQLATNGIDGDADGVARRAGATAAMPMTRSRNERRE